MLTLRSFVPRRRRQSRAHPASSAAGNSPSVADGGRSPIRHEGMTVDVSLPAKWGRYLSGINATRREEGTFAALELGTAWGASFVKRQISAARDRAYDKRTGLDTVADHPGLEFPDGVA